MSIKPKKSSQYTIRMEKNMRIDLEALASMSRRDFPDFIRIIFETIIIENKEKLEEYRRGGR